MAYASYPDEKAGFRGLVDPGDGPTEAAVRNGICHPEGAIYRSNHGGRQANSDLPDAAPERRHRARARPRPKTIVGRCVLIPLWFSECSQSHRNGTASELSAPRRAAGRSS